MIRLILNVIWLVFEGLWMAIAYAVAGLLCFVLIITIPFGIAAFRVARYVLWPFGRTIERRPTAGVASVVGNAGPSRPEITNNIELPRPVRTRVLTTSPLETFSVGNTIVVSRGLIDVLPDEGSLAMVLSHELAHIVLGHNLGSQYAFNDRMLFSDEATYQNLGFKHIPEEEAAADKKAIELLKGSPYAQKLDSAGLFIKALQARAPQLSALLQAHLGNNITENGTVTRMAQLGTSAPALDWNKLDQIAALPLGGRRPRRHAPAPDSIYI